MDRKPEVHVLPPPPQRVKKGCEPVWATSDSSGEGRLAKSAFYRLLLCSGTFLRGGHFENCPYEQQSPPPWPRSFSRQIFSLWVANRFHLERDKFARVVFRFAPCLPVWRDIRNLSGPIFTFCALASAFPAFLLGRFSPRYYYACVFLLRCIAS